MPASSGNALLQYIRSLVTRGKTEDQSDACLLNQFASLHDETAFAVLLKRHGAMVMSVCLRILHDKHLAEDAFQATFLVLALKAGAIRRCGSAASWLYGVALRLAHKLKARSWKVNRSRY